MLDFNAEWQVTEYMFNKPHYWSLVLFYQDDGFGSYVWAYSKATNVAVYAFISEDLH